MKPEYKDLRLIIECPEKKCVDVICEFFGLPNGVDWDKYKENTCVDIQFVEFPYIMFGSKEFYIRGFSSWRTTLSFSDFQEQYLNKTDMEFKIKPHEPIDLSVLGEQAAKIVRNLYNGLREIEMQKKMAKAKPQPTTVKDIVSRTNLSSDMDKKVEAYKQLLACAEWANEQPLEYSDGVKYSLRWSGNGFPATPYYSADTPVFEFNGFAHYCVFVNIEGIEDLLKTFYGI